MSASTFMNAQTPIADVLKEVDPATGKAKDSAKEFTVVGVVATRVTLPDDKVVAFVIDKAGEPALQVLTDAKSGAALVPRTEVKASGTLGESPLGTALQIKAGSLSVTASNKMFGLSEQRGGAFFKDASSLAGRYVQLTNVAIAPGPFGSTGTAIAKSADGSEVSLLIGKGAFKREAPGENVNVFGIPVKIGDQWKLAASLFRSTRAKEAQAIGFKRTCLTCHNPDTKLIGPPYREVAARYKNDPEALNVLMNQMEKGGVGKWGPVPMPPQAAVTPEERKALAEWIMSYRWDAVLAD